jgi:hypothetical protein
MKKFNLTIILMMLFPVVHGQAMATFDAASNAQLIKTNAALTQTNISTSKNLAEAVQHTKYLDETLKFWKETQKALEKVTNAINTTVYVSNLVKREISLINQCSVYSNKIGNMKHLDMHEISAFTNTLSSILSTSHELLTFANNLIKNGLFKMNDSERLKHLSEINDKLEENLNTMSYCFSKADNLNRDRSLRSMFH